MRNRHAENREQCADNQLEIARLHRFLVRFKLQIVALLVVAKRIRRMNIRDATRGDVATLAAIDLAAKRSAMPTIAWPRSEAELRWFIGERLIPTGRVVV
ncbi:MAG: hypothetical protein JO141_28810, partial [Bradyrhizobium sp.]|nr:hypothetical protein [Bradyrhizobium sp.]